MRYFSALHPHPRQPAHTARYKQKSNHKNARCGEAICLITYFAAPIFLQEIEVPAYLLHRRRWLTFIVSSPAFAGDRDSAIEQRSLKERSIAPTATPSAAAIATSGYRSIRLRESPFPMLIPGAAQTGTAPGINDRSNVCSTTRRTT